jgi:flagellar hook-associated protein 3 FlgL
MFKANRTVASGKRIIDLSDDPVGLTQALNIKSTLSNMDQLGRNIAMGTSWLKASESALSNVQNLLSDAKALSVQMVTATTDGSSRMNSVKTVQNMMEEIIGLANTQVSGRYIFAGSKTDSAAFLDDGTYDGDTSAFQILIGKGETLAVGHDGNAVFGSMFTTLTAFKTALETNDPDGIRAIMDDLDDLFDDISNSISDVGAKTTRLEIRENIFEDLKITSTDRLSKIEDADITEALTDLAEKELTYKAALASSSKVMELSLVDYIR